MRRIHAAGKLVAVHVDLVEGLRPELPAISWLGSTGVDAVISSHGQLMPAIQRERMVAIHRLLLVRRSLLGSGLAAVKRSGADIVEILPGVILPDVSHLLPKLDQPLLAGGFIRSEAEARSALAAGGRGDHQHRGPMGSQACLSDAQPLIWRSTSWSAPAKTLWDADPEVRVLCVNLDLTTLATLAGGATDRLAVDIESVSGLNADDAGARFVVERLGIGIVITRRPALAALVAEAGGLGLVQVLAFDSTGLGRAL